MSKKAWMVYIEDGLGGGCLREPTPADGWLPINTAPKDGTHILLFWDKGTAWLNPDGPEIVLARWLSQDECVGGRRYWEPHFVSVAHEALHLTGMTHWMALPKPPSVTQ